MSDLGLGGSAPLNPPSASPFAPFAALSPFAPANLASSALAPITRAVPRPVPTALGLAQYSAPPVDPQYQRNMTTLTNKYAELSAEIAALPEPVRNALIDFDSNRVANGSAPLTKQQTLLVAQTAVNNQPATPEAARNPLNVLGNVRGDLSDILKSIPRLPLAMLHEAQDLPNIGTRISEAQQAGVNPITALLQAPGIRMIPGAYTAGNLLNGTEGVREALTHPVQTALDVLPIAHAAASQTAVGKLSTAEREAQGLRPRPINAVLGGRVLRDADGNLVLGRTRAGSAFDMMRDETKLGQALDAFGGRRSRDVARARGALEQRWRGVMTGVTPGVSEREVLAQRLTSITGKYADEYPMFRPDATGPEFDVQRAEFYNGIQRNPDAYNPALVNELRDAQIAARDLGVQEGFLGMFDDEVYDSATAGKLRGAQSRIDHGERIRTLRNEYLAPSGTMDAQGFQQMMNDILSDPSRKARKQGFDALVNTLDAYGVDVDPLRKAVTRANSAMAGAPEATWGGAVDAFNNLDLSSLAPRRSLTDIIKTLRQVNPESRIAGKLEQAIADGNRGAVSDVLRGLERRKQPMTTRGGVAVTDLADDARSMVRRLDWDETTGRRFSDARQNMRTKAFERMKGQAAPARFHALIGDATQRESISRLTREAEQSLGRTLTPEEAGQLVSAIEEKRWTGLPGIDDASQMVRDIERETTATWRALREAGHDPVFVHKVSPGRATSAQTGNINPVAVGPSVGKERVIDLSPGVQDVQVSLSHQASELLQQTYNEQFVDQVIGRVGKTEAELRDVLAEQVRYRMQTDPSLDFDGHFQAALKRGYEKFNPDSAGFSWGGAKLDKYRQANYYIPKSVADNLHRYAKPPSIVTSIFEPLTKAFRYNVIGLAPSVMVNNFFSNAVAMTAESGPGAFKYWSKAREWLRDPSLIPDEQLRHMVIAEHPMATTLNRDAWLASRTGQRFMAGFNGASAFRESAIAEGAKRGLSAIDSIAQKNMHLQQLTDNLYRSMQYMDEVERGVRKGKSAEAAANAAMESVRRTFVDYTSFTPIERSAMRTIIPFYSYMGHAARFIMRYPLDHPLRASLAAKIAAAEKDRLGALPGSFLSMIPVGSIAGSGAQLMIPLRPFDAFGDISDLLSLSGWMSATNPVIQTALEQIGVVRGEAELYPTMRYDPETGRMKAVHGNILIDLFNNTVPRAGLITAALGINSQYNDTKQRDPAAANRMLLSAAGVPKLWRSVNVPQEQFRAELSRQRAASDVKNDALKSGDWTEAMRYPSLAAYFEAVSNADPATIASMTPADREAIAAQIQSLVGSG